MFSDPGAAQTVLRGAAARPHRARSRAVPAAAAPTARPRTHQHGCLDRRRREQQLPAGSPRQAGDGAVPGVGEHLSAAGRGSGGKEREKPAVVDGRKAGPRFPHPPGVNPKGLVAARGRATRGAVTSWRGRWDPGARPGRSSGRRRRGWRRRAASRPWRPRSAAGDASARGWWRCRRGGRA